jgi:arginine decarboxylase
VEELLGASVERLHFDDAWYAYARFNPIYRDRFAMHGDPENYGKDKPTIFATQSTHKLLAALSQASFIHVRDGRRPIEHGRFNEAFMMHASTSPQYAIIASNDVSAAMMDGPGGESLTTESIREAVAFRQMMARSVPSTRPRTTGSSTSGSRRRCASPPHPR